MAKKTANDGTKNETQPLNAKPATKPNPGAEPRALEEERERVRKAALAASQTAKPGTPATKASSTQSQKPPLLPESVPPVAAAKATQPPPRSVPEPQKAPSAAASAAVAPSRPSAVPPSSTSRPVPPAKAPVAAPPITPRTVSVRFALDKPQARQVSLCGDFNNWSPDALVMHRQQGGRWEATVPLKPGRYQYKFVVDGDWVSDPAAKANVPNTFGSLNSVIEVQA